MASIDNGSDLGIEASLFKTADRCCQKNFA
jgi:hypothetical protein